VPSAVRDAAHPSARVLSRHRPTQHAGSPHPPSDRLIRWAGSTLIVAPQTTQPWPATAARCESVAAIDGVRGNGAFRCSAAIRRSGVRARSWARGRNGVRVNPILLTRSIPGELPRAASGHRCRQSRPARAGLRTCSRASVRSRPPRPGSPPGRGPTVQFLAAFDALLSVLISGNCILAAMHPGYCPQCGERVTPYAAGCALCGADLDPKRWQKPVSVRRRLSVRMPAGLRRAIRGRDAVRLRDSL